MDLELNKLTVKGHFDSFREIKMWSGYQMKREIIILLDVITVWWLCDKIIFFFYMLMLGSEVFGGEIMSVMYIKILSLCLKKFVQKQKN